MAKQITKGDTFGFAIGSGTTGPGTRGASITCSGRTARTSTRLTSSARRSASRRRSRRPSSGEHSPPSTRWRRPPTANSRDAFIAGKLGMWMAGSWNVTGLREAKVDFAVAPMPRLLKQPVVWTIPHQYTFPKPKAADPAKRDAAWAHIRWMTDHVAEWTLKAGQVSAFRKAHSDPRITGDPVLRTLLAQAPNWQVGQPTPKWVAAENLTRPVIETVYIGQKTGACRHGGPGEADQRAAHLAAVSPPSWCARLAAGTPEAPRPGLPEGEPIGGESGTARPGSPPGGIPPARGPDAVPLPAARSPPLRRLPPLPAPGRAAAVLHQRASGARPVRLRRPRQLREAPGRQPIPGEPRQHRLLHRGQHAADPRGARWSSPCSWTAAFRSGPSSAARSSFPSRCPWSPWA